jgi:hypothetical protein
VSTPIRTATLAEIYARQGQTRAACEIYAELVAAHPEDAALRDRLVALLAEQATMDGDDRTRARTDRLRALLARVRARRRRVGS